ncbi:aminopeptidase P N-terminal domain-containing protein [Faecalicatena sp. Marseille-Q4148]|nr:aminopeptidase P N-terminal domain-containing protein [Faecalicatena sp. Marseille-Q4148]
MQEIFRSRRETLLGQIEGPAMILIFSGKAPMRSLDESYPFSVDRNFYYLTGIERENMILVLKKDYAGKTTEELYIEPYDEYLAKWVGGRMRSSEAMEISGVQNIRYTDSFFEKMNGWLDASRGTGKIHVHLDLWRYKEGQADTEAHKFAAKLQREYPYVQIDDIVGALAAMRCVKSDIEIDKMKRAQETTRCAIEAMMKHAYPGVNECELEGAFDFALMKQGVKEHAFPSIVAGGVRATTLHYQDNNQEVKDGELVLIDLGSANEHYCADISRTFPVNGKFTERQKEIYNTVLEAQDLVIAGARPGLTFAELNQMVVEFYESKLDELGLRKDGKGVGDYYYHGVSHGLGLDTHDLDTAKEHVLRPGMVITVEPGLYIEEEAIGVRIENDILITEDGAIDLSSDILKTVEDIENFMRK